MLQDTTGVLSNLPSKEGFKRLTSTFLSRLPNFDLIPHHMLTSPSVSHCWYRQVCCSYRKGPHPDRHAVEDRNSASTHFFALGTGPTPPYRFVNTLCFCCTWMFYIKFPHFKVAVTMGMDPLSFYHIFSRTPLATRTFSPNLRFLYNRLAVSWPVLVISWALEGGYWTFSNFSKFRQKLTTLFWSLNCAAIPLCSHVVDASRWKFLRGSWEWGK